MGVRDANARDLADVVRVHRIAFQGFFLDRMGSQFLKAYYAAVLSYEASIFLVHVGDAGEIDGFAVGFRDPGAFYEHFGSRRLRLAPTIAWSILRSPSLIVEILRNTRRIATPEKDTAEFVELSSIGTSRLGAGIGSILLQAFCRRSGDWGATEVTLTTDRDNNDAVIGFYLGHGFEKRGTEARGERILQILSLRL